MKHFVVLSCRVSWAVGLAACFSALALCVPVVRAYGGTGQQVRDGKNAETSGPESQNSPGKGISPMPIPITGAEQQTPIQTETIAVLPWAFQYGTKTSRETAENFLDKLLVKMGIDKVPEARVRVVWVQCNSGDEGGITDYTPKVGEMPTPAQMLRVGLALHTDWVMAESAAWHSRSIWVGLGPKTKSTCTVCFRIVDVKNRVVALDENNLAVDDTAKEDVLKALGTLFISDLFTVVSGGPKTPHEQRAVELAIAKALQPWIEQHLQHIKIDQNAK